MRRVRTLVAILLAASMATACAASGASTGAEPSAPRVRPPQLATRGPNPQWSYAVARDGKVIDLRIAVMIDRAGNPDLSTLKVTGLGATENRDAVEIWVRTSTFRPAEQGGEPVAGLFETSVIVKRETRVRGAR